jgi:hypothetical protein
MTAEARNLNPDFSNISQASNVIECNTGCVTEGYVAAGRDSIKDQHIKSHKTLLVRMQRTSLATSVCRYGQN